MEEIKGIQFGIQSPEDIKNYSVCVVNKPEPFSKDGLEIYEGGPCDLRMGAFDRYACKTCLETKMCPGHFGMIKLAVPIFNITFLEKVREILDYLCLHCCRLKLSEDEFNSQWTSKLKDTCKNRTKCPKPNCGQLCPSVSTVGSYLSMTTNGEKDNKSRLFARRVYEIFNKMNEDDLLLLDLPYHPSWLLFTNLPVLPNPERPTFDKFDSGHQRSVDKLTLRYKEIILHNNKLEYMLGQISQSEEQYAKRKKPTQKSKKTSLEIEMEELLLQDEVTLFYTPSHISQSFTLQKSVSSSYSRGGIDEGRPLQTRLKGKAGQLRGNLMGKRVDFSARTVITGDPNLDLNQVGVPTQIAATLTIKERVWQGNMKEMQKCVDLGPSYIDSNGVEHSQPLGAKRVIRKDENFVEELFDLRSRQSQEPLKLEYGDIVERHLRDNDLVIFNRQPTLHRMSLLAMKIKIMKAKTFRMNVCFTTNMRVMTSRGFLFRDEIETELKNEKDPLKFICYDKATRSYVERTGKIVDVPNLTGDMIEFTQLGEASRWNEDIDLDEEVDEEVPDRNSFSLQVTRNHQMYIQKGCQGKDGRIAWISKGVYPNNQEVPFDVVSAENLLSNCEICTCGQVENTEEITRFLADIKLTSKNRRNPSCRHTCGCTKRSGDKTKPTMLASIDKRVEHEAKTSLHPQCDNTCPLANGEYIETEEMIQYRKDNVRKGKPISGNCLACNGMVRFLSVAENGITRSERHQEVIREMLLPLGIDSDGKILLFFELFGMWLGMN